MTQVTNILCVCLGNGDRSPFMAALLKQMLDNQGIRNVPVESAGVMEGMKEGGQAPLLSVQAAPTYGIDLSTHKKRHVSSLNLADFDLLIAADKETQACLLTYNKEGAEIICLELDGAANAWQTQNPRKVDDMIVSIYAALLREVIQYRFRK